MARDETMEQVIETVLHHSGVKESGMMAKALVEEIEHWVEDGILKELADKDAKIQRMQRQLDMCQAFIRGQANNATAMLKSEFDENTSV